MEKATIRISIVIPCYNGGKYINTCIKSIVTQNFKGFEVIFVDDGSNDDSWNKICDLTEEYEFIHGFHQKNAGVTKARWMGVQKALGEWVAFVDVDDTLLPNALADLYTMVTKDTDLIVANVLDVNEGLELDDIRRMAICSQAVPPAPWGKLYRRSVFNEHIFDIPREIFYGEDALMNIRYLYACKYPPRFLSKNVYNYVSNSSSVSHLSKRSLDYEYMYHKSRLDSIESMDAVRCNKELIEIRLNGLRGIARVESQRISDKSNRHPFILDLYNDIRRVNYSLGCLDRVLLTSSSPVIIKIIGNMYMVRNALTYRLQRIKSRLLLTNK